MKKLSIFILLACAMGVQAAPQEQTPQPATAQPDAVEATAERNHMLYSLGFMLGNNVKRELILDNEDDYKALSQGLRDSWLNRPAQTDINKYKPQIIQKYKEDARTIASKREQEQKDYLTSFAKEKGVKTLDNGAMIKLSRAGKGKTPKADDTVKVHYTGTLIDGTKFDSSRDRGEAFQTKLTRVIPCWTKAMQHMKPGSQAKVVCPPDTAYGNRPVGAIPPNSVLVFDVEMLDVEK